MSKQNIWGEITWIFLHTLAECIDNNKFLDCKNKVIQIIKSLCFNLPCPDCSEHATSILNKAYINNIKTKEHLVEFLRQFHNIVNIKLKKKELTIEELKNKYSKDKNILINIMSRMINIHLSIKTSERLITKNLYRREALKNINNNILQLLPFFL